MDNVMVECYYPLSLLHQLQVRGISLCKIVDKNAKVLMLIAQTNKQTNTVAGQVHIPMRIPVFAFQCPEIWTIN